MLAELQEMRVQHNTRRMCCAIKGLEQYGDRKDVSKEQAQCFESYCMRSYGRACALYSFCLSVCLCLSLCVSFSPSLPLSPYRSHVHASTHATYLHRVRRRCGGSRATPGHLQAPVTGGSEGMELVGSGSSAWGSFGCNDVIRRASVSRNREQQATASRGH